MEKLMLMVSVPLGDAEQVVQLATKAGASGATILHAREMVTEPKPFQLEPQRDIVMIVLDPAIKDIVEDTIQKGTEDFLSLNCIPILSAVGLDKHSKTDQS